MSQRKAAQHQEPKKKPADVNAEDREEALDEALDESFPASDPVAIAVDHESEPHGKRKH
jgi:hypothetical protein